MGEIQYSQNGHGGHFVQFVLKSFVSNNLSNVNQIICR